MMPLRSVVERAPWLATARGFFKKIADPEYPPFVMGFSAKDIHVLCLQHAAAKGRFDVRHHVHSLPAGLITLEQSDMQVAHVADFAGQVQRAFHPLGGVPDSVSVLFPDTLARFSVLEMDELPVSVRERQEHVSWKLSAKLPYPVQEARVVYDVEAPKVFPGRYRVSAVSVRRPVLAKLDEVFQAMEIHAGFLIPRALAPVALT